MSSALPPPNSQGSLGFPNPQSGGIPPPPPAGQLGAYDVAQYSPSPTSSSPSSVGSTHLGRSPTQRTMLNPGEIQAEKEKIFSTFRTKVEELRSQVKEAPTQKKAGTVKKIEEEILKVRSKAANQLASLNLRGAAISLNESFDALDNILGKKVPMKPSDVAFLPEADWLQGILRVVPEERFVISEKVRNEVYIHCMAALQQPAEREKLISLLGADKNISDKSLKQKLISQLALVKPGVLPPEGWVEKSSDLKKLNTDIKDAVQRDLLELPLKDYDLLNYITLDEIGILTKELSKQEPIIPEFLRTRLTKERPEPAILQALETAFSKDLGWRVEAQRKIQQLLNKRT